ncbi:MAG: gamma carbonic anhydrase family protein [Bdellovibrionaceae bacterium]|nr:gamma carbonic anhydrase family protein [Pseudobdellovibrionaceae bacterium]
MLFKLMDWVPEVGSGTYVAPTAQIIGQVKIGRDCSIWFNAILRGDVGPITVGDETNIQDGTVVHCTYKKAYATIGARVTVGHNVMLHGCRIDDKCLIGMGSTIMDNAHIPAQSIVGAGSLVTENAKFEPGHLILGRPAKAVRPLTSEEIAFLDKSADNYLFYKKSWYQNPQGGLELIKHEFDKEDTRG